MIAMLAISSGCNKPAQKTAEPPSEPSKIKAVVQDGGPAVLTTTTAEFQVLPSGYIKGALLKDGKQFTLDEPQTGSPAGSDYVVIGGKRVDFVLDFSKAIVLEAAGKMGHGKRIEIPGHPLGPSGTGLHSVTTIEAYDEFPNFLLTSVQYKNEGQGDVTLDRIVGQDHRFNAALADAKTSPFDMWSFQGSSYDWGKDDVFEMKRGFTQPNDFGAIVKGGYGGGVPVDASQRVARVGSGLHGSAG